MKESDYVYIAALIIYLLSLTCAWHMYVRANNRMSDTTGRVVAQTGRPRPREGENTENQQETDRERERETHPRGCGEDS